MISLEQITKEFKLAGEQGAKAAIAKIHEQVQKEFPGETVSLKNGMIILTIMMSEFMQRSDKHIKDVEKTNDPIKTGALMELAYLTQFLNALSNEIYPEKG